MDREELKNLIKRAVTEIPEDVLFRLREMGDHPFAKAILENIRVAKEEGRPICQDTGLLTFVLESKDMGVTEIKSLRNEVLEAVKEATKDGILRPNAIERPHKNTGTNVATGHPHLIIIPSERNRLWLIPKGGGSIAVSRFYTLKPIEGEREVAKLVVKTVLEAGGKACPPYFVFAAAGGTEESSMLHAKLLMLKDLREPRTMYEEEVLKKINELGIGIMGLGEGKTALDFRITRLAKHPAVTSLSVIVSCRALRKAYLDLRSSSSFLRMSSIFSNISSRCFPIRYTLPQEEHIQNTSRLSYTFVGTRPRTYSLSTGRSLPLHSGHLTGLRFISRSPIAYNTSAT